METLTYQQRIGLVLRHIEQHLDARPNLEELARIACFSPYHFHRIFSSMVGESVAAYVRRLLLERAAMQLGHSPESVTQIALGAGYDSVDAFTRAFRAHLGMLPSEYRRRKGHLEVARRRDLTRPLFYHEMSDLPPMNIRVEKFAPRLVAAVRHTGPYDESFPAWEKLCGALEANGLLSDASVAYGVSYDNPDITAPQKCRMDASACRQDCWKPVLNCAPCYRMKRFFCGILAVNRSMPCCASGGRTSCCILPTGRYLAYGSRRVDASRIMIRALKFTGIHRKRPLPQTC